MDLAEKTQEFTHRHPWEISRRSCLCSLIASGSRELVYADVGAGDMYVVEKIKEYTDRKIFAIDTNFPSFEFTDTVLMFCDLDAVDKGSVDRVLLLDVLEHIEKDDEFLSSLAGLLRPGGQLLISVPAFQILFSPHDLFLKHFRRYTASQLESLAHRHGLETVELFYFYSGPFIVRCLEMILYKLGIKKEFSRVLSEWQHSERSLFTRLYTGILNLDFKINHLLAKFRIKIPGLSLCLLCRKKSA
jgi:SAM-dependent methyltransferase